MIIPGVRPAWLDEARFPYASRYLDLDGHVLHYVDEGHGPVLLMLHGNPTWSFAWRHLIQRLRPRFRCIALDYPGFGLSVAAEGYDHLPASHARVVEAFVGAMDLPAWTPVVQDWGGPIGLWVAGRQPDRVRGLVLGNTMAWPVADDPHFRRFSAAMGGPLGRLLIQHANAFVELMIPLGTRRRRLSAAEMEAYRRPTATADRRRPTWILPREIVGSTAWLAEVAAGLSALAGTPALLCWGDRDIAFRASERARFEQLLPRARTVPLRGAGHYVQEDAPDEIAEALVAWWDEEVAPPGA